MYFYVRLPLNSYLACTYIQCDVQQGWMFHQSTTFVYLVLENYCHLSGHEREG